MRREGISKKAIAFLQPLGDSAGMQNAQALLGTLEARRPA
jgi:hypothetical protein